MAYFYRDVGAAPAVDTVPVKVDQKLSEMATSVPVVTSSVPVLTSSVPAGPSVTTSVPVLTSSVPVVTSSVPAGPSVTTSVPVVTSSVPVVTSSVPAGPSVTTSVSNKDPQQDLFKTKVVVIDGKKYDAKAVGDPQLGHLYLTPIKETKDHKGWFVGQDVHAWTKQIKQETPVLMISNDPVDAKVFEDCLSEINKRYVVSIKHKISTIKQLLNNIPQNPTTPNMISANSNHLETKDPMVTLQNTYNNEIKELYKLCGESSKNTIKSLLGYSQPTTITSNKDSIFKILDTLDNQFANGVTTALNNIRSHFRDGRIQDPDLPNINVCHALIRLVNSETNLLQETLIEIGGTCVQGITHRLIQIYELCFG
jgi:hypothetical protein